MSSTEKTTRINATISLKEQRALAQMAKDNHRSMSIEARLAIQDRLRNDGRLR